MIGEIETLVLKNERRVTKMKAYRSIVLFLAVLILFSLTGCGGGGGGGDSSGSSNSTAQPTVSSTSPANNATGVAVNSAITATFSKAMDSSTINASTFTLSGGVTGTVTYDSATNTATFTPSSSLANSTTYTATITTGVKDSAGNAMASNYTWSFTTAASSSFTPTAGKWSGSNIQFNVSSDGSKITASGSSVVYNGKSYALIMGPVSTSGGACTGTATTYLASDISINALSFNYSSSYWTINGQFNSSGSSSGTYSYSKYESSCGGTLRGSGSWSASPATSKSYETSETIPDNSSSAKYEYKYDPVTGDLVEVIKYTYE